MDFQETHLPPRRSLDLVPDILALIKQDNHPVGARVYEAKLARKLGVSRPPVRAALQRLESLGVVKAESNKGFLLQSAPGDTVAIPESRADEDELYTALATDHFDGLIPDPISEQELLRRYGGTSAGLRLTLARIASEGWAERQKGYGWKFLDVLRRPEAYAQIMRMRQAIEPIGLLESTFGLTQQALTDLRDRQNNLLERGLANFSVAELFQAGCDFHEAIAQASGNTFLIETLKRYNAIRRLFTYKSILPNHEHLAVHIQEHLHLLDLIGAGELREASLFLQKHLVS